MTDTDTPRIAIIIGSTRPERNGTTVGVERKGKAVGRWVHELATKRDDARFELIDLVDVNLPLLDEPWPPSMGRYSRPHTLAWAQTVASFDGFVFVTPEYNGLTSAALKNALDFLHAEWRDKAAGFVGYGAVGGSRAVEHLRPMMGELGIADVAATVSLTLTGDFVDYRHFKPAGHQADAVHALLDEVVVWTRALRPLRAAGTRA